MQTPLKSIFQIGSIFASALLGILFLSQGVFAQSLDYRSFDADVRLHPDGSMIVRETIDVIFYEDKHGIYRKIPVIYRDAIGNRLDLGVDISEVLLNGDDVEYSVTKQGKQIEIKIGNPNTVIDGEHIYEIVYRVEDAMRFFESHDELYWNITGTQWEAPIEKVTATIVYPNGVSAKEAYCYTGNFGSTKQECAVAETDGKIGFASEDFLTVSLSFEKGAFVEPSQLAKILELLRENAFAFLGLLPIVLAFLLWLRFGRDEPIGPIIAEFEAPPGISAGLAGTIMRPFSGLDNYAVAGMVVELAVLGYLKIVVNSEREKPKSKEITLEMLKPADDALDMWQKRMLGMLFSANETAVTLDAIKFGPSFEALNGDLKTYVQKKLYEPLPSVLAVLTMIFGIAFGIVGVALLSELGTLTILTTLLSGGITAVIGAFIFKKSSSGGELYRKVAGFKLFIQTAERYRTEWESKQHIFSKILPYALAFRDVDHWAGLFKQVPLSNETWISNAHGGMIDAGFVLGSLSGLQTGVSSAVPSSSSGSSGSGGGGFSGGGFGGGGGGSW